MINLLVICCKCGLVREPKDDGKIMANWRKKKPTDKGRPLSHGYCKNCYDIEMAKIEGKKP